MFVRRSVHVSRQRVAHRLAERRGIVMRAHATNCRTLMNKQTVFVVLVILHWVSKLEGRHRSRGCKKTSEKEQLAMSL